MDRDIPQPTTVINGAVEIIKRFEGCRLTAYLDGGGVPTVGYGHTSGVFMGLTITQDQADQWLMHDVRECANAIRSLVRVPLTDNQLHSLLSFTFNVGRAALAGSTLLRKLNDGDYAGAGRELSHWVYDNGKRIPGLVNRRAAELELWSKSA